MIMHDYNQQGKKVVLLLHPMLASGSMLYDLLGKHLGENVRCLAPDFASHGEEREKEFKSASEESEKIAHYLTKNGITHIDLAYGASLGGVVLTQLLKKGIHFDAVFFEGTSFFEGAKMMTRLLSFVFLKKHRRAVADHAKAVTAMGNLYGEQYAEAFADQFIGMTEDSIRNIAAACGDNIHADLPPEEQRKCVFSYGSKDFNVGKAKKGCKKIYPHAKFQLWNGYGHCEKITADTENYIQMLKSYLK
ncbi:MAG: alpha/beta hydrolase [Lachnospiraceae bacterium]|nr:alpha/beta hydrolase [Lachnospiraceae bacterium]